jgi:plasmid stabilization system protein ParE
VKTPVIISPAAELDLAQSRDWYESVRSGLSRDFELAFDAALCRIARNPQSYEKVGHGLRRALLHRFPHAIFYRERPNAVQVVAVLHPCRHPRIWQSRSH